MTENKYSLYIGLPQDLKGVEYQYFSPDSGYQLAYSNKPIRDMEVVPTENESLLTGAEKVWLRQAKLRVNAQALREHEKEYVDLLNGFLDAWEKELDAQVNKAQKSKDTDNGDE